jgi:hypothetical protein
LLKEPEIIDPLDWVISVRVITYSSSSSSDSAGDSSPPLEGSIAVDESVPRLQREDSGQSACGDYSVKKVHKAVDFPISRTATVRQLYRAILKQFPHLKEPPQVIAIPAAPASQSEYEEGVSSDAVATETDQEEFVEKSLISIAKGFSTGPPLTLKSSVKLSWDPPALVTSPDAKIDHPSLNFRDGILVLVRSSADWQRALTQDPSLSGPDGEMAMSAPLVRTPMKPLPPWKTRSSSLRKAGDAAGPVPKTESPRLKEKGLSLGSASGACSKQA